MEMWRTLKGWLSSPGRTAQVGTIKDLAGHIQRLVDAPDGSWLRVELIGREDAFLQFQAGADLIQIDHTLIMPQQVEREDALRKVLAVAGVTPYETRGSGSKSLDFDVPRDCA